MRTRWFGEPWPDAELRAPVCDDDAYRVPTPVGMNCLRCELPIADDDQGVVIGYSGELIDDVTYSLVFDGHDHLVVAEHLYCMLLSVLGAQIMEQCDP